MRLASAILLVICLCGMSSAWAEPFLLTSEQEAYAKELIKRSDDMKLSEKGKWRALMHYHDRLFSSESTIDTPAFFTSPDGKKDLKAELHSTIRAFFTPMDAVEKIDTKSENYRHPQCLFPARFKWLNAELGFDRTKLSPIRCSEYQDFKKTIGPEKIAMIYTSAYMGNPASLFGHTLLRIDSKGETPLLSHAVNYGALTGNDGGLAFMLKGVFGGYPGLFSVYPYYDTVNLYNNMENRDIWEYRLNLSHEQVDDLVAHIWELGHNSADYYFFSENCSYMLLETLNVIYPDVDMTAPFYRPLFSDYTIPVDTVRTVLSQKDALSEAIYRPSRQTKIKHAYMHLTPDEKAQLRSLMRHPREPEKVLASELSPAQKANVLGIAYEYIQYQFIAGNMKLDEMRTDSVNVLKALNTIKEKSSIPEISPPAVRPDQGHLSGAMSAFVGRRDNKTYIDFNIRPAYHTLLDETGGFIPYGAITYMDTTLRWYENENDLKLQKFNFVEITSLPSFTELFHPFAMHISVGFESYKLPTKDKEGYVFFGTVGGGLAHAVYNERITGYFLTTLHAKAGGYLEHNSLVGAGIKLGIVTDFDKVRLTADVEKIFYSTPDATTVHYKTEAAFSLMKNVSLISSYLYEDNKKNNIHEWKVGIQVHF